MSQFDRCQTGLFVGFTAVFMGYFSVWLPGPNVGLTFLGVEMGEWIKFLGLGMSRNLFYVPPITLGLMMVLLTTIWSNGRWQTWLMRGLAIGVSFLIFPSLEIVTKEPPDQWLLRLLLIGLVIGGALLSSLRLAAWPRWGLWLGLVLLALIGAILPTWIYFMVRPVVSVSIRQSVGIGLGVWLNGLGHLLVMGSSVVCWRR